MRKIVFLTVFLFALTAAAQAAWWNPGGFKPHVQYIKSSGEKTSSAALGIGKCVLYGIWIATNGTNDVTISLYDNTAASGKKITPTFIVPGGNYYGGGFLPIGAMVDTDIYLSIATSGTASVVVYYDDGN